MCSYFIFSVHSNALATSCTSEAHSSFIKQPGSPSTPFSQKSFEQSVSCWFTARASPYQESLRSLCMAKGCENGSAVGRRCSFGWCWGTQEQCQQGRAAPCVNTALLACVLGMRWERAHCKDVPCTAEPPVTFALNRCEWIQGLFWGGCLRETLHPFVSI